MSKLKYPRTDYDRMASDYDRGRALSVAALGAWQKALERYLRGVNGPLLDLGSGTGIFSLPLAEWFNMRVVGVEPSAGMRRVARRERSHPRVAYVGGVAERIPLTARSCGAAWLSTVVHHFDDLDRGASEVRRVVRDGGPVLIRSAFAGRTKDIL